MKLPLYFCLFLSSGLLLFVLGLSSYGQAQSIRYVKADGTGDGSSWTKASGDMQAMIDASASGDQVWVAAGLYKPGPAGNTDRASSFVMKEGVRLYGGFRGSESDLTDRPNVDAVSGQPSSTSLSGNIGSPATNADNSYHVIVSPSDLSASARLDGFVIQEGFANGLAHGGYDAGAGLLISDNSSPSITHCVFQNNNASFGGGVYIGSGSSAQLTGCLFEGNSANEGTLNNFGNASLIGCRFQNNTASVGGAIFNGKNLRLVNCRFLGNSAFGGGAIFYFGYNGSESLNLVNCHFEGNSASDRGGAIYHGILSGYFLVNCSFLANSAKLGGAICEGGNITGGNLVNCSFLGNSASESGGAIYQLSGITRIFLYNSVLFGNGGSNTLGGGAKVVTRFSLFDNTVTNYSGGGSTTLTTDVSPFASATDLRLKPCSAAINTGDNQSYAIYGNGSDTDLAGQPRLHGDRIDRGAYEYQGEPSPPLAITQQPVSGSSVCVGAVVTATVSVSGTEPVAYQWYQDGASISDNSSATTATLSLPAVTTASAGSYVVVVSSSCGSLTSTAFSLTVNSPPTASLLSSGTLTCATTSVTLTAGGGSSYSFSGPGGPLTSSGNQVVVSEAGLYSVSVTATSGCVSTTQITLEQDLTLAAPSLTASATASVGQPISVTAQGCPGGTITWEAQAGAGAFSGAIYTLSQPGDYTLSARCTVGSCTSPASTLILRIETGSFHLIAPSYDCATGAITFNTAGGDGSLVEYMATGITPWSANPRQQVEDDLREDPKKLLLMARQSGMVVSYRFDLPAFCAGLPTPPQSSTNPEPVRGPRIATQTAYQGQPYRFEVPAGTFTDPQGEPLLYYALSLPPGLGLVGTTISGTPTTVGKWTVTLIGVDPVGQTANTSFQIQVLAPVPDLTVLLYLQPSVVYGTTGVRLVAEVVELNGLVGSRGVITVRIPRVSGLSLALAGGQSGVWGFTATNVSYYELSTSQVIGAGESLRAELTGLFSGGATSGQLSVSATVVGGGEVRVTNNSDAERLEYFQQ